MRHKSIKRKLKNNPTTMERYMSLDPEGKEIFIKALNAPPEIQQKIKELLGEYMDGQKEKE